MKLPRAPRYDRHRAELIDWLSDVRAEVDGLRAALPELANVVLRPRLELLASVASSVVALHHSRAGLGVADDLSGLLSATLSLHLSTGETGVPIPTEFEHLSAAQRRIVISVRDALAAAAALGVRPRRPSAAASRVGYVPKGVIGLHIMAFERELNAIIDKLDQLEEFRTVPTNFVQQSGLLRFFGSEMRLKVYITTLLVKIDNLSINFGAVAQAVDAMMETTTNFVVTVRAWRQRISPRVLLLADALGGHVVELASVVKVMTKDLHAARAAESVDLIELRIREMGENLATPSNTTISPFNCFVSYAWGDSSPSGVEREQVVDKLCAAAHLRGVRIIRDKDALRIGDRISEFMKRIGEADRVFVIISEKYLRSPYCMFELFEVWRNCRQDSQEFLSHIRVYTLPDAHISSPEDRAGWAVYWQDRSDNLAGFIKSHGPNVVGQEDFRQFKLMGDFSRHLSDVLAIVADVVRPRSIQELEGYGLEDLT
jgi:internalin A